MTLRNVMQISYNVPRFIAKLILFVQGVQVVGVCLLFFFFFFFNAKKNEIE